MEKKKKIKIFITTSLVITIGIAFCPKAIDHIKSSSKKNLSVNEWNEKVNLVKKPGREIASVKDSKLDIRVKKVASFNNKQRDLDRKISSQMKIHLEKNEKINPDFQNDSVGYRFVDYFYAIKDSEENRKRFPGADSKLGYLIVESKVQLEDGKSVVLNSETGNIGIFTGILKVKLSDINYAHQIIPHNNFIITNSYDHINVVHYEIADPILAIETQKKILLNPYVKRVRVEILEYQRTGR